MQIASLRTATRADVAAIRDVAEAAWWDTYRPMLPEAIIRQALAVHYDETALHRHLAGPITYFLAEKEERLLGFLAAELEAQGILFIHRLYLHPEAKGQGLGKRLMNEALAAFPTARLARLYTNRRNPAVSFYLKQGFRIRLALNRDIAPGCLVEDYRLEKPLAPAA